jgi:EAL domain-containing protein (putative c-di-GMP-specific phosphodiesterase class I)
MFALEVGCTVIAEGIETREELDAAALVGIDAVQGFYVSPPAAHHVHWDTSRVVADAPLTVPMSSITLP